MELEYVYRLGKLHVPRLISHAKINHLIHPGSNSPPLETQPLRQQNRSLKLKVEKPGFLDSLRFVDDLPIVGELSCTDIEVEEEACEINFKDVLIALGQTNELVMAGEFAGRILRVGRQFESQFEIGDRVCGFGGTPYASCICVNGHTACRLPDTMSFTTAASILVVFSTAYYALVEVARVERGQTVLIHSAAGGIGHAALRVAEHIGAEIFVTVGNSAKQDFLVAEFGLSRDHIFSSQMTTFKQGVRRLTNGKGVDVVLNSLSGEALQESWDCIAPFGVFVELGKVAAVSKGGLNMEPFDRNATFAAIALQMMCQYRPQKVGQLLTKVLSMLEAGHYQPVQPITPMPIGEIQEAFRLL